MSDYIIRAIADNDNIRAFAAITTATVEEARRLHNTSPVATAALGRTLTASAMMGAMLKGERDNLTIQIKGDGELGGIVAVADSKANVRGYVYNPQVEVALKQNGKLDVSGAIGHGYLNVIKDIGLKDPYTGMVPLISGEIGEDLTYYFSKSEQVNSAVGLGVLIEKDYSVDIAGGFIIQAMPGIKEESIIKLEQNIGIIESVTGLFKQFETPEEVLKFVLNRFDISIIDKMPTSYACTCTKERVERALISLGRQELKNLIDEQKETELSCHFCNNKYLFDTSDLERLYDEATR